MFGHTKKGSGSEGSASVPSQVDEEYAAEAKEALAFFRATTQQDTVLGLTRPPPPPNKPVHWWAGDRRGVHDHAQRCSGCLCGKQPQRQLQ